MVYINTIYSLDSQKIKPLNKKKKSEDKMKNNGHMHGHIDFNEKRSGGQKFYHFEPLIIAIQSKGWREETETEQNRAPLFFYA